MKKGKFEAARKHRIPPVLLLLAALLIFSRSVGGTLAWLTDQSGPVTSTFTASNIRITLTDTAEEFKMIPGNVILRDPTVTVNPGSESCWLFVELQESANFQTYLSYQVAEGWTQGDGSNIPSNVWYQKISSQDQMGTPISILSGGQVTVNPELTSEQMDAAEADKPTLTVTAYACQLLRSNSQEFTPEQAWQTIRPAGT